MTVDINTNRSIDQSNERPVLKPGLIALAILVSPITLAIAI